MRSWFGSILFVLAGAFAVASGCGNPEVVSHEGQIVASPDASVGGDTGSGATGGSGFTFNEGGASTGTDCPASCAELNADCGFVSDTRCGGAVQCGTTCPKGQICGGLVPNRCGVAPGDGSVCKPACAATEVCIGGACKVPTCPSRTTCAKLGYACGPAGDNCGGLLDCGSDPCPGPDQTCGGGVDAKGKPVPGVCGCTGACSKIPTDCPAGTTTTLTGKVYDPAGRNPLYHVFVYIANNPADPDLKAFPKGTTCDVCGASAAGSPLTSDPGAPGTYTDVDGSFTLHNVPVDQGLSLVIQLGRWRRVFTQDVATKCAANAIPDKTLLMPSTQAQGNIPLMAMMTGNADSLECVLRKMGIADSEFTNPAQNGRVQFYLGGGAPGQAINALTPVQSVLFGNDANSQPVINGYDMAILSCQGGEYLASEPAADQTTLRNYADAGGRVFATHYSYTWLRQNNANAAAPLGTADNWSEVAKWHVDEDDRAAAATGIIDKLSNPKANAFQGWLEAVGASTVGSGTTPVVVIRHDTDLISTVPGQTQQWLYRAGGNAKLCTVAHNVSCTSDANCAAQVCSVNTAQACSAAAPCAPLVCKNRVTMACAVDADCTGNRGPCVANTCVANTCGGTDYTGTNIPLHFTFNTPVNLKEDLTKTPPAVQCGRVLFSDFHVLNASEKPTELFPADCGAMCANDAACTGKCTGGKCPWGSACAADTDCPSTCEDGRCLDPMNAQEKLLEFMIFDLGSCVPPKVCVPIKACPAGQDCGHIPDGCGKLIHCGDCPAGELCGVGEPPVPNQCGKLTCDPDAGDCGAQVCTPKTCNDQHRECDLAGDYCGNKLDCGTCAAGELCVSGKCKHIN